MASKCVGKLRLDERKKFFTCVGGEALEQVAQRSCVCPIPGSVGGQVRCGFEQPGGRCTSAWKGDWNQTISKVPANSNYSMIL